MSDKLVAQIAEVLAEGRDATIATLMADGSPQATTVSYASDGLSLYFGCSSHSVKAENLARDPRVAVTVNLPYRDWGQIRGLSIRGRARRLEPGAGMEEAALLFLGKFSEIAQYMSGSAEAIALFEVTPEIVGLLDYRRGFGHVEHCRVIQAKPPKVAAIDAAPVAEALA